MYCSAERVLASENSKYLRSCFLFLFSLSPLSICCHSENTILWAPVSVFCSISFKAAWTGAHLHQLMWSFTAVLLLELCRVKTWETAQSAVVDPGHFCRHRYKVSCFKTNRLKKSFIPVAMVLFELAFKSMIMTHYLYFFHINIFTDTSIEGLIHL